MPFDDIERSGQDGKRQDESDFDYLNTSARPEAQRVRTAIAEWLKHFPEAHRKEVINRIRGDDTQFSSATFELFLHEVCLRLGWRVEIHPALSNGNTKRPDFRVETPSGSFYLEATFASQFSSDQKAAEQRKKKVLRAIDDLHLPNFHLGIYLSGNPQKEINKRKLNLQQWIKSLDLDDIERRYRNREEITPYHFSKDGWSIHFRPIPRKSCGRNALRRTIWILGEDIRTVDVRSSLHKAAKKKAGKYGNLDLPLVVAVNLEEDHVDITQERDALFGTTQYCFDRNTGEQTDTIRKSDGVWRGPPSSIYTRLSAVWVFRAFDVWRWAARSSSLLYLNSWATHPAPESLNTFPRAFAVDHRLREEDGTTFREIFEVPEEWPTNSPPESP
ncbi:MAG: hypothetical protein WAN92_09150 [Herbaspirillum sp.]